MELPCPPWSRHFPSIDMDSPIQKLPQPCPLGMVMKTLSRRQNPSLTLFLAPIPSLENGELNQKCQASSHGLFLYGDHSNPGVSSLKQKILLSLKKLQGIYEPGTRANGQTLKQKMTLVLLSLRKLQGFQKLCTRNQST